jgi:phenylacetate-CoA ligase
MWVHPEGIGEIVAEDARTTREYVCILEPDRNGGGGDRMRVLVESLVGSSDADALTRDLTARFKAQFGVTLAVECVEPESLERYTARSSNRTGKTRRLVDARKGEEVAR